MASPRRRPATRPSARSVVETEPVGIVKAWATLAPAGDDETARHDELRDIARALLRDVDTGTVWRIWHVVRLHVEDEKLAQLVGRWKDIRKSDRGLVEDAQALLPRLRRDLREAVSIHRRSESAKWYSMAVGKDGLMTAGAKRPWTRYRLFYERMLKVVETDPNIAFLTADPFHKPKGSPVKRRNKALRDELNALKLGRSLGRERINAILRAVDFIRRPARSLRARS